MMKTRTKRGIAVVTVLLAMVVLLMLTGAFLRVNRDNFSQVNSSERRDQAKATCAAAYNYVLYRLEHDKNFATADFTGATDRETGSLMVVTERTGSRVIDGEVPSLKASFEAAIENNLNNDAETASGVPGNSARVTITADCQGITRSVETLIRVAPLFDSSALSRGTMNIESNNFYIRSRDEYRNMIRAEGEIHVPNVLSGASQTQFLEPGRNTTDSKGMIWSKESILAGGTDVAGRLDEANTNSGGRFVPEAKQHFEIYNLRPEDIRVASSSVAVEPGEYRFTMATANVTLNVDYDVHARRDSYSVDDESQFTTQEIHVMEYYAHPDDPAPTKVYRSETKTTDISPTIPYNATLGDWEVANVEIVYDTASAGGTALPVDVADVVYIDSDGGSKVAVDLKHQRFMLPPGETVTAAGDFMITTERGDPPIVSLGHGANRAGIVADGSINLQAGVTQGFGTLIAKDGDLLLRPEGSRAVDLTASGQDGLVAYAGRDVLVENPNDGGGSWNFNGLVYARNNFDFQAKDADVHLEGTLVARDGSINIEQAGDVNFVYNPDYLDAMLEALPENRLQVEKIYWKES